MRRFVAVVRVVRRPVAWLPLLLLVWLWFFWGEVTPSPRYVVRVGAPQSPFAANNWRNLQVVSDDGSEVIVCIHDNLTEPTAGSRLEAWDTRTGEDRTPRLWHDPEWLGVLSASRWWDPDFTRLAADPSGREFLGDEAAWSALRQRFAAARGGPVGEGPRPLPPAAGRERPASFPDPLHFSADGRLLAYATRDGRPVFPGAPDSGDGAAVEDVRTGERVATLPGTVGWVVAAPGGQAAVSVHLQAGQGGQPRLALWDLARSQRPVDLPLPALRWPLSPVFRADGRCLFLRYFPAPSGLPALLWWDAATGQQVGHIDDPGEWALMDGDRVLVTHPLAAHPTGGFVESYQLCFWDVTTGAQIGEWKLDAPTDGSGLITRIASSEDHRYLAADFDADARRPNRTNLLEKIGKRLGVRLAGARAVRREVLVWDVVERREVARLPGRSATLSRNGRWLGSIDDSGVVRVWELPVGKPWGLIFGYAAAAALACWVAAVAVAWVVRRLWNLTRSNEALAAAVFSGGSLAPRVTADSRSESATRKPPLAERADHTEDLPAKPQAASAPARADS